jgi:hypothetical protein
MGFKMGNGFIAVSVPTRHQDQAMQRSSDCALGQARMDSAGMKNSN